MNDTTRQEWERRVLVANAEGMRWTCEQAGHPKQLPDDVMCICETWARHIKAGAVVVGCEGRPSDDEQPTVDEMAGTFDGPDSVEWLRGQRDQNEADR